MNMLQRNLLSLVLLLGFGSASGAFAQMSACLSNKPKAGCLSPVDLNPEPRQGDFSSMYGHAYSNSSKGKEANKILNGFYQNIDKQYFKWCSVKHKCRFMDDDNLARHRQTIHDKKEKNIVDLRNSYQTSLQTIGGDKDRVKNGQSPKEPGAAEGFDKLKREVLTNGKQSIKDTKERNEGVVRANAVKKEENNGLATKTIPDLAKQNQDTIDETNRFINEDLITQQDEESAAVRGEIDGIANQQGPATDDLNAGQGTLVPGSNTLPQTAPDIKPEEIESTLNSRGQALIADGMQVQGQRAIDQANTFRNFQSGNTLPYQGVKLSDTARTEFESEDTPDSYRGYQNILLFNAFAETPTIMNKDQGFNVMARSIALRLQRNSPLSMAGEWGTYFLMLDQGWSMVDYAKGLAKGIGSSIYNTWSGLASVLSDPAEAAAGLYWVFQNWDTVKSKMGDALVQDFETLRNCHLKPEECGKIKGQLVTDIASLFVGSILARGGQMGKEAAIAEAAGQIAEDLVKMSGKAGRAGIDTADEMKRFIKFLGADCFRGLGMEKRKFRLPSWETLLGVETAYAASPCDFVSVINRMDDLLGQLPAGTNVEWVLNAKQIIGKLDNVKGKLPGDTYEKLVKGMNTTAEKAESIGRAWMEGKVTAPDVVKANFNGGAIAEAEALNRLAAKADVEIIQWDRHIVRPNGQSATNIDIVTKESGRYWLTEVKSNAAKWKPDSMQEYVKYAKELGNAGIRVYYENHAPSYLENIANSLKPYGFSVEKGNLQFVPFK